MRRQYVADESEAALVSEEHEDLAPPSRRPAEPPAASSARKTAATSVAVPGAEHDDEHEDEHDGEHDEAHVDKTSCSSTPPRSAVLAPAQIVKGYGFEKGRFVTFGEAELKALAEASRQTIDIVSFIPEGSVDPVYYDKAYYLAPDRQGSKPYSLLRAAMQDSCRTALAKWAWRAKEYVVEIRPVAGGLVLQQLLYADEVRTIDALGIELVEVGAAELQLARRLIEQISDDAYHSERFVDEEKQRILAAVERKIAGRTALAKPEQRIPSAQVIDLVAALRASLDAIGPARPKAAAPDAHTADVADARERKPARRAGKAIGAGEARPPTRPRGRQSAR